jgi:hypothetical protein
MCTAIKVRNAAEPQNGSVFDCSVLFRCERLATRRREVVLGLIKPNRERLAFQAPRNGASNNMPTCQITSAALRFERPNTAPQSPISFPTQTLWLLKPSNARYQCAPSFRSVRTLLCTSSGSDTHFDPVISVWEISALSHPAS